MGGISAFFDRKAAQILGIALQQVKGIQEHRLVTTAPTQQLERRKPVLRKG